MTAWKNLHFRPPILKPEKNRMSELLLLRSVKDPRQKPILGKIFIENANYFIISTDGALYQIENHLIEWTEVPT